jgi:hypothetical protein
MTAVEVVADDFRPTLRPPQKSFSVRLVHICEHFIRPEADGLGLGARGLPEALVCSRGCLTALGSGVHIGKAGEA